MSSPQIQTSNAAVSAMNLASQNAEQSNNQETKKACIFGRAARIAYKVVTYIPKKIWAGIKYIYNAIQKSIHDRKVGAVQANNVAYIARAKAACQFTGNTLREDDVLKHHGDLVRTELLQKVYDVDGRNFSSRVLDSNPERMKKGIAAADKQAAVTDDTKKEFRLQKQYEKLVQELKALEGKKSAAELELDEIAKKSKTIDLREGNNPTVVKELRRVFNARNSQLVKLEADIKAKDKALNKAFEANARHIGDQNIPLDAPVAAKETPKAVTKAEIKAGIAKASKILTAEEESDEYFEVMPSFEVEAEALHEESEESKSLLGRAKKWLAGKKRNNAEEAELREMAKLQAEMTASPQEMADYHQSRQAQGKKFKEVQALVNCTTHRPLVRRGAYVYERTDSKAVRR